MNKWLQFVRAGAEVQRFHATRTLQTETVGHHSHGVAMLCYKLAGGRDYTTVDLILAALTHDLAESIYGDIPAPTKRELNISAACDELESRALHANQCKFALTAYDEHILKMADILDGMLFCVRERQLGNTLMADVYARYAGYFASVVTPRDSTALTVRSEVQQQWRAANGSE